MKLSKYSFVVYLKNGDTAYPSYEAVSAQHAITIMKRAYRGHYKRFVINCIG